LFSAAVLQRYRTSFYRWLRQPLFSVALLALGYPIVYLCTTPFTVDGNFLVRLHYAVNNLPAAWSAMAIQLAIAGAVAALVKRFLPAIPAGRPTQRLSWGNYGPLQPSPIERSLSTRFLFILAPFAIALVIALMVGTWLIAETAAREMLGQQLKTTAQAVAGQAPYFFEVGQDQIKRLASDPRLLTALPGKLDGILEELIKSPPFFSQLVVVDQQLNPPLGVFPDAQYTGSDHPHSELIGIQGSVPGYTFQTFSIPPRLNSSTAQTSFIELLPGEQNDDSRYLIGRVDLSENPLTKSLIANLNSPGSQAMGMLVDDNLQILAHPDPAMVMSTYSGDFYHESARRVNQDLYIESTTDGSRSIVYYQPMTGAPWTVVMSAPMAAVDQLALRIAAPLLGVILALSVLAGILLVLSTRTITRSLNALSGEVEQAAQGRLDQPFPVEGVDEVGQLQAAFEKLRHNLKASIDEQSQLAQVSQGVASHLEFEDAVQPVLQAALKEGASLARIVLTSTQSPASTMPGLAGNPDEPAIFSLGPSSGLFLDLDNQLLTLNRSKELITLANIIRPRAVQMLTLTPGLPYPTSLIALALSYEDEFYGSLWVAYDQFHHFSEEEMRFLKTLASQAGAAAAKARLFNNAESGRQRLAAILASSPDAALVTDKSDHLVLANPAAWQIFGIEIETNLGQPIEKVITQKEILQLLQDSPLTDKTGEVLLPNGRAYLASVSNVEIEGQAVGRVCVLRDVTKLKELDTLKSDYVANVSHDLRTPITLIHGYAHMLEMVGQLNEQQNDYLQKMVSSLDGMSRLVNNLLDQNRLESGAGIKFEMVSACEPVEQVVNNLQMLAGQRKVRIKTEFPPQGADLKVEADPVLLHQALFNLVENAVIYSRSEGRVIVRVQPQTNRVVYEINDNGIGISPMDQPRIFEKFFRGHQDDQAEIQGSGLGLSIVAAITEQHGGKVWFESQLGKGSTFYLAIPLLQKNHP
jgi:PAS domain S-box-containing protein